MRSGLPEIPSNNQHQRENAESQRERKNKQSPPKISYRGITLKQYFRQCSEVRSNEALGQIKEESCASSNSSISGTPTFNHQDTLQNCRAKIKTEVCQNEKDSIFKRTFGRFDMDARTKAQTHSLEKNQKGHYFPMKKKDERKKIFTKVLPSKEQTSNIRSTLTSFYQVEENKKKMLKKIQQEKDRVNDPRLSEAFFITKYGSRFRIDSKILQND